MDGVETLLRELGHEVFWRDPDYPAWAVYGHVLPRMWRGAYEDVASACHTGAAGTAGPKAIARLGRLISDAQIARIRAAEPR